MTTTASSAPPVSHPPARRIDRVRAWLRKRLIFIILIFLILALLFVFFWPDIFVEIGPGEAGVLWRRFGGGTVTVAHDGKPFIGRIDANMLGEATTLIENVEDNEDAIESHGYHVYPYGEGMRFIWPWNKMFVYNIRLQQTTHTYEVLTSDGLEVTAEVAITWKPIEADLGKLHRDIGPDYVDVLLVPIVGAAAREEIARYTPDGLYSSQRLRIQENIRTKVRQMMLSRFYPATKRESYLIVEDVLIKEIRLPAEVRQAIEEKVAQKHLADSYVYRLQRERQEADRKAIEAEGIRRFQETINATISDGYLKWKGIDATLELAKSPNAKVVVIGTGGNGDGLPIILGNIDNPSGTNPPAPASTSSSATPPVTATTTYGPPAPP